MRPPGDAAILISLALILAAPTGLAQSGVSSRIEKAERERAAAARAAASHAIAAKQQARAQAKAREHAASLMQREIEVNAKLRTDEDQTAAIAARLASLVAAATQAQRQRDQDAAALKPLILLMVRLSLHPSATLLAADAAPGQAVQGALIMRGLTRKIAERTATLTAAQARLTALRRAAMAQQTAMRNAIADQKALRSQLESAIAADQSTAAIAGHARAVDLRQAERAGREAKTLTGVIARLRAQQGGYSSADHAAAAHITVPFALRGPPVAGQLVRRFGESTIAGPATGDTFATPPSAIVSAPCAGRIAFAQRFQSYGNLMILTCRSGDDFVIAGVDRFSAAVGQSVVAGQPVAQMADLDPKKPSARPKLYVQLRHDGTPVDPSTVFAAKP